MLDKVKKAIENLSKGHPRCNHTYIHYVSNKDSKSWFCDAPGCKKSGKIVVSMDGNKKQQTLLPPNAYVSVEPIELGGSDFYGLRTNEQGKAYKVEKNKWLDRKSLLNILSEYEIFD